MTNRAPFPDVALARPPLGVKVVDQNGRGRGWEATEDGWNPVALDCAEVCHGFALEYSKHFIAAYASADTMWLQLGHRAWDATTIARVTPIEGRLALPRYRVTFVCGAVETVTLSLPRKVLALHLIDTTRDEIASIATRLLEGFGYLDAF